MSMKFIVPIFSGKGGVGKSTVAVNLAVALAQQGVATALVDSDFYGPSIPTMLGGGQVIPDPEGRLLPPSKFGLKYISLGFFLPSPDAPVLWRGPMFNKALRQLFEDVAWGEIEICIVDMPPGTGDAQISLTQMLQLSGGIVVTTPQELALADVRKAVNMLAQVKVPVLGVIENMSGFVDPQGQRHDIFGSGGGQTIADMCSAPLLAQIPIDMQLRASGDKGEPAALDETSPIGQVFHTLARKLQQILLEQGDALRPVEILEERA
jgi:ATP-binding protein involved in chromosome partitioning